MNSKLLIGALVVVVVGMVGYMASQGPAERNMAAAPSADNGIAAVVYKSPSCGCCGQYATYLRQEGYAVATEDVSDMAAVKAEHGVPYELESCHTMEIAGYVVEGHIPEAAVQKLLAEKPDIKGIGMAGMPSGSPGMPGPKREDFVVYEITHEGTKGGVFMTL